MCWSNSPQHLATTDSRSIREAHHKCSQHWNTSSQSHSTGAAHHTCTPVSGQLTTDSCNSTAAQHKSLQRFPALERFIEKSNHYKVAPLQQLNAKQSPQSVSVLDQLNAMQIIIMYQISPTQRSVTPHSHRVAWHRPSRVVSEQRGGSCRPHTAGKRIEGSTPPLAAASGRRLREGRPPLHTCLHLPPAAPPCQQVVPGAARQQADHARPAPRYPSHKTLPKNVLLALIIPADHTY